MGETLAIFFFPPWAHVDCGTVPFGLREVQYSSSVLVLTVADTFVTAEQDLPPPSLGHTSR